MFNGCWHTFFSAHAAEESSTMSGMSLDIRASSLTKLVQLTKANDAINQLRNFSR